MDINKKITILFCLFISVLIVCIGSIIYIFQSNEARKKEDIEKQDIYYLASLQQASQNYYLLVYTKNGETHYPHFYTEKQADMFVEHLETQGIVIKNGYDKEYIKGDDNEH